MKRNGFSDEYLMRVKASIVDSTTDFIGIADADGRLLFLNDAAYAMMGYAPDERPEFETIADVHANDFDKFALSTIQPAVMEQGSWSGVGILKYRDGSPLEVSQLVFPVTMDDGSFYGTAAVMKDISELKHVSHEKAKQDELLQKILDTVKIGVVLINMESNTVELVNKFAEELLMKDESQIIGEHCYDILCHRPIELCPHVNERDKDVIVAERYLLRQDGTSIPIIKAGTWVTIDNREYLIDTLVDISIQKELEQSLTDAKISAEAANRSKSEFLSRMSHEMRTPLNAVIGMTQIASRTSDLQRLKDAISTIEISSMHLLGLINDVLDLSKIEEGKLELSIEAFSLSIMMDKLASLIETKAAEKAIEFNVSLDAGIPDMLIGDSMRLSQVLLNFLSNAVKFTPDHGEIRLNVGFKERLADSVVLGFSVSDTGIGISGDQLSRLFNPFVQADGSISRRFGGSGLGLVISKRIVNLMGSDIEVETRENEGTRFAFDLELQLSGDEAEQSSAAMGSIEGVFEGKRALIVDDVEINRIVAAELLSVTGLAADEAENGREAVNMVTRGDYDIVFMDVQMPIMDGYEATKQIRKLEGDKRDTIIVAMSANVFREDVQRSLAAGMNAHIGKPIDLDNVVEVVSELMLHGRQRVLEHDGVNDSGLYENLKSAMERGDFEYAVRLSQELHVQALAKRPTIASYAGNVYECLVRGDYDYASMYMADLVRAEEGHLA